MPTFEYSGPYRWDEAKERNPMDYGVPEKFTKEQIREWNLSYASRRDALFPSREDEIMKGEDVQNDEIY